MNRRHRLLVWHTTNAKGMARRGCDRAVGAGASGARRPSVQGPCRIATSNRTRVPSLTTRPRGRSVDLSGGGETGRRGGLPERLGAGVVALRNPLSSDMRVRVPPAGFARLFNCHARCHRERPREPGRMRDGLRGARPSDFARPLQVALRGLVNHSRRPAGRAPRR